MLVRYIPIITIDEYEECKNSFVNTNICISLNVEQLTSEKTIINCYNINSSHCICFDLIDELNFNETQLIDLINRLVILTFNINYYKINNNPVITILYNNNTEKIKNIVAEIKKEFKNQGYENAALFELNLQTSNLKPQTSNSCTERSRSVKPQTSNLKPQTTNNKLQEEESNQYSVKSNQSPDNSLSPSPLERVGERSNNLTIQQFNHLNETSNFKLQTSNLLVCNELEQNETSQFYNLFFHESIIEKICFFYSETTNLFLMLDKTKAIENSFATNEKLIYESFKKIQQLQFENILLLNKNNSLHEKLKNSEINQQLLRKDADTIIDWYKNEIDKIKNWYNIQYEILPLWFKKIGHIIKKYQKPQK